MSDIELRDISVTFTRSELIALKGTVTGELESLTDSDIDSGVFDELFDAQVALNRAWSRYGRRLQRAEVPK